MARRHNRAQWHRGITDGGRHSTSQFQKVCKSTPRLAQTQARQTGGLMQIAQRMNLRRHDGSKRRRTSTRASHFDVPRPIPVSGRAISHRRRSSHRLFVCLSRRLPTTNTQLNLSSCDRSYRAVRTNLSTRNRGSGVLDGSNSWMNSLLERLLVRAK